jgi:hypothetical protein
MKPQEVARIVIILLLIIEELILLFWIQGEGMVMAGMALLMIIIDITVWKMWTKLCR